MTDPGRCVRNAVHDKVRGHMAFTVWYPTSETFLGAVRYAIRHAMGGRPAVTDEVAVCVYKALCNSRRAVGPSVQYTMQLLLQERLGD